MNRFSSDLLKTLRNKIPIQILIESELKIPCKYSEGVFRFLCPLCGEFMASVKKETNLARCFVCHRNINTIEIVMYYKKWKFVDSVKYLEKYYNASLKESSGILHMPPKVVNTFLKFSNLIIRLKPHNH